jgi:hypothetical protein
MRKKIFIRTLCYLFVGVMACGAVMAQGFGPTQALKVAPPQKGCTGVPYWQAMPDWPGSPIFTNLAPGFVGSLYDCPAGGYYVLGPANCLAFSEQWIAVSFWTGPSGGTAGRLQAAVVQEPTCLSTARVLLGIYTDDASVIPSVPGTPVIEAPARVPTTCGLLAQVAIPATPLAPNTKYWLTARTAPGGANQNLAAIWYPSNNAQIGAQLAAVPPWFSFSGLTPAGAVLPPAGGN